MSAPMTVKSLIFGGILLFLLNACGLSYLGYAQQTLHLQIDQNRLLLHGSTIQEKRDNFSTLFLSRKLIRLHNGRTIVYEEARTDLSYEFEPTITRSVKIIFEAVAMRTLYSKNNLFAYQLLLANGIVVNVMAQQDETQELKLLYGMSNAQLNQMLRTLDPHAVIAAENQAMAFTRTQWAFLTKWDTRKVHLVPLVVPVGRFMGPF